jgi:DeoR/GlpR family transcriptional regulator of sugar metabolism
VVNVQHGLVVGQLQVERVLIARARTKTRLNEGSKMKKLGIHRIQLAADVDQLVRHNGPKRHKRSLSDKLITRQPH